MRCDLGTNCFIQNYFDHEPGPHFKDYACGYLSYDGHRGTDFRVVDEVAMAAGVPVIAAASGVVLGVRDGVPDLPVSVRGKSNLVGKDAGNGVVIDHGDGWQTQYSHLRMGSVIVAKGERVDRGQQLGMIGESGNAEFPHVDFSVRHNGVPLDPFQPTASAPCNAEIAADALWGTNAKLALSYIPTAILQLGFADHLPDRLEAQSGKLSSQQLSTGSLGLVLWAQIMGMRDGDRVDLKIEQSDGRVFVDTTQTIYGNKAVWVGGVGKRRSAQLWVPGVYHGSIRLFRQGKFLQERQIALQLR